MQSSNCPILVHPLRLAWRRGHSVSTTLLVEPRRRSCDSRRDHSHLVADLAPVVPRDVARLNPEGPGRRKGQGSACIRACSFSKMASLRLYFALVLSSQHCFAQQTQHGVHGFHVASSIMELAEEVGPLRKLLRDGDAVLAGASELAAAPQGTPAYLHLSGDCHRVFVKAVHGRLFGSVTKSPIASGVPLNRDDLCSIVFVPDSGFVGEQSIWYSVVPRKAVSQQRHSVQDGHPGALGIPFDATETAALQGEELRAGYVSVTATRRAPVASNDDFYIRWFPGRERSGRDEQAPLPWRYLPVLQNDQDGSLPSTDQAYACLRSGVRALGPMEPSEAQAAWDGVDVASPSEAARDSGYTRHEDGGEGAAGGSGRWLDVVVITDVVMSGVIVELRLRPEQRPASVDEGGAPNPTADRWLLRSRCWFNAASDLLALRAAIRDVEAGGSAGPAEMDTVEAGTARSCAADAPGTQDEFSAAATRSRGGSISSSSRGSRGSVAASAGGGDAADAAADAEVLRGSNPSQPRTVTVDTSAAELRAMYAALPSLPAAMFPRCVARFRLPAAVQPLVRTAEAAAAAAISAAAAATAPGARNASSSHTTADAAGRGRSAVPAMPPAVRIDLTVSVPEVSAARHGSESRVLHRMRDVPAGATVVVRHSTVVGAGFSSGGSSGGQPGLQQQQQAGGLQLDTDEDEDSGRVAYAAAQAAAAAAASSRQPQHAAGAGFTPSFIIPGIRMRRAHRLLPRCKVLRVVNVTQPRHGRAFAVPTPATHALPCLLTGQSMSDADIRYLRDPITGDIRIPTLPDGALQKALLTGQCVGPWAANALHTSTALFHLAADALTPTTILYIASGVPPAGSPAGSPIGLPSAQNASNSGAAAAAAAAAGPAAWFATSDNFKYQVTDGLGPVGAAGTGLVKVTFPSPKAAGLPVTPDAEKAGLHAESTADNSGTDDVTRPPQPLWPWCVVRERDALAGVGISPLSALAAAPLPWGCVTAPSGKGAAGAGGKASSKRQTTATNGDADDAVASASEGVESLAASVFRLLQGDLADCSLPAGGAQPSGCSLRLSAIYGGNGGTIEPLAVQRTGLAGRLRLLADGRSLASLVNNSTALPAAVESANVAADGSLTQVDSSAAPVLSAAPVDCLFLMGIGPVQCLHSAGAEGALQASSARQSSAQRAARALQLLLLREHNAVASELVAALLRHYHDSIVPAAVGPEPPAFAFSDPSAGRATSGHAFQMEAGHLQQQQIARRARAAPRSAADRARAEAARRYHQAVMRLLHPTGPPTAAYALSPAAKARLLQYASTLLRWVEREEGGVDSDAGGADSCGNESSSGSGMDEDTLSWFRRHEWIDAVSPQRNASTGALPQLPHDPPVLLPLPGLTADVEGVPYAMPAAYPFAYDGGLEAARAYDRQIYETARSLVLARWRELAVGEWQAVGEAALLGDKGDAGEAASGAAPGHGAVHGGGAALPSRGGLLDGALAKQLRREGSGALRGLLSGAEAQLRAVLDSVRALQSTAQLPLQHTLLRAVGALP